MGPWVVIKTLEHVIVEMVLPDHVATNVDQDFSQTAVKSRAIRVTVLTQGPVDATTERVVAPVETIGLAKGVKLVPVSSQSLFWQNHHLVYHACAM